MTADDILLEVEDIELSRGGRILLSGLTFSLNPGQLALVMGPNGTGKTTLLRAIAGLAPPTRGQIRLAGRPIDRLESQERALFAYQAHLEAVKKDLTIDENLLITSRIRGTLDKIHEVVAELGLGALTGRPVRNLSAGQKRRVTLANLRLSGAKLWLLDEPLTNLDQAGQALVAGWLDRHLAGGGIAVVATHLAEALRRPGSLLVEL